jgi:hypothetical protein
MADQTQRLEIATVKAEVGSNILYLFANAAETAGLIETESGEIKNLKQIIADLQEDAAEKISVATTIFPTAAAGLAATADGGIFLVQSAETDEIFSVWKNEAGAAVNTGKTAMSSQAIQDALTASSEAAQAAEQAADIATTRTSGFLSPSTNAPTVRDDGLPLQVGDRYFNTEEQWEYIYKAEGWLANDSLAAIAGLESDLASSSDPARGASQVGFEGGTVADALIAGRKLANYTALRNYSGRATRIEVTQGGIAGVFNRLGDSAGHVDNSGTTIVGAYAWGRDYGIDVDPAWFGAVGNGIADDGPAFTGALGTGRRLTPRPGTYMFLTSARIPKNGVLRIHAPLGTVVFKGAKDLALFTRTTGFPTNYVRGVDLEGIIFDGGHIRNLRPYKDYQNDVYGFESAFGLEASQDDPLSFAYIQKCLFKNCASLPFALAHFADVKVSHNTFFKTKDPGLRYCKKVVVDANFSEWSADNGFSVSRGNKNVALTGNVIKDCTSDGLFVSGWNTSGPTSVNITVTGQTYITGSTVTVVSSGNTFVASDQDTLMNVRDSSGNVGVMKVIQYQSANQVQAVVLQPIPAAIQGVATNLWALSPHNGPEVFTVSGNTVIGGNGFGISALKASGKGTIGDNTVVRTGVVVDSEKVTKGSIAQGSNTLTVLNASDFSVGDGLIIDPKNSLQAYFIARITAIAGNVITLAQTAPQPYGLEDVRQCFLANTGVSIGVGGNNVAWNRYANKILIDGNNCIDYRSGAITVNPYDEGSGRDIVITNNVMDCPSGISVTSVDIHVLESVGMQSSNIVISRNTSFNSAARMILLQQRGTGKRSIFVADNFAPNMTTANHFQAFDLDNSSVNVTALYQWTFRDAFNAVQNHSIKVKSIISTTNTGGVVSIPGSLVSMAPATNGENVTDFVSAVGDGSLMFVLANYSGANSITIKNNSAKIRTKTNADVTIPPNGAATFIMLSPTVALQVG